MVARKPRIFVRQRHRAQVTFKKCRPPNHDSGCRSWSSYSSRPPSVSSASSESHPSVSDHVESEKEAGELSWEDHAAIHGPRLDASTGQIRLLQILRRQDPWDETVHCHIFKTCLFDEIPGPPLFNALSYVWGDKNSLKNIVMNGNIIPVRSNLESALRHFRDHHVEVIQGLPLWVDAVCINQDDTEERNQQVTLMGKIYKRAHHVLPWLGEGNFDTDWLLPLLDNEDFRRSLEAVSTEDSETIAASTPWATRALVVFHRDLLKRAWWTRVWVIQELLLANRDPILIIGRYYICWMRFVAVYQHAVTFFERAGHWGTYHDIFQSTYAYNAPLQEESSLKDVSYPTVGALDYIRSKIPKYGYVPLGLMYLSVDVLTKSWATHPADYVYALQGLACDEEKITVDYSKHPLEIFHDFMRMLWTSRHFYADLASEFNYQRRPDCQEISGIPSWVPDLSKQHGSLARTPRHSRPWRTAEVRVSQDGRVLYLRGIYLDKISRIWCAGYEGAQEEFNPYKLLVRDLEHGFQDWLSSNNNYRPNSVRNSHDLKARFVWGLLSPLTYSPKITREYNWLWIKLWDRICGLCDEDIISELVSVSLEELPTETLAREALGGFLDSLKNTLANAAVFETDSGLIGMGPTHMKAGDCLVFPFGMTCPWITRPVDPTGPEAQEQTMVGAANIEDFMFDKGENEKAHGLLDKAVEYGVFKAIDIELV